MELSLIKIQLKLLSCLFYTSCSKLYTFYFSSAFTDTVVFLSMQELVPCDFIVSIGCGDSVVICGVNGGTNMIVLYHWYNGKTQNVFFPTLNALLLFLSHKFTQNVQ